VRCVYCSTGRLRPTRLTLTLTFGGNVYPLVDSDGLLCDRCNEEFISQHAAAALTMADRTQRPHTPVGPVAQHADIPASGAGG
jgi:hypothetical protein